MEISLTGVSGYILGILIAIVAVACVFVGALFILGILYHYAVEIWYKFNVQRRNAKTFMQYLQNKKQFELWLKKEVKP